MTQAVVIKPYVNELPSHFADRLGRVYAKSVTSQHKKDNGQFFTPKEIANYMAGLVHGSKGTLRILDPGCGTAILSCSLIERIANHEAPPKEIELTVFETDKDIIPYTKAILDYLGEWLEIKNLTFKAILNTNDFILENKECFELSSTLFFKPKNKIYDIVISNPPYFKISKEDKRAAVAKSIVWGQPNIYAIFMMVSAKLLKDNGQFIFITPRSFASGNYFRAFRNEFFQEIELEQIHLFGSRTDTFDRDSVLQETLIIKGRKQKLNGHLPKIILTHSNGIKDIQHFSEKVYDASDLIDFHSKEKILHLPTNETEDEIIKLFKSWEGNLNLYDIQISTGPVVSFRATQYLHEVSKGNNNTLVPLFQLINTTKMSVEWPLSKKNKPQYIELCENTKSLLIPNKNYIFLRRFSAKDDKSRLIAAPYFIDITQAEFIGVENHLNYIYRPKGHLDRNEILGLSALLNSSLFDTYFRTFNGNINVSSTELREMPLPPLHEIKKIGDEIILANDYSQEFASSIVNELYNIHELIQNEES